MFCPSCGRPLPHNDFTRCPSCGTPLTPPVPASTPSGGQIGLPERPSQDAETVLSQQGQTPTPGVGVPTSVSDPAARVLATSTPPQAPQVAPAAYNQPPQAPHTPQPAGAPPAAGGYGQQQWPMQQQPQQPQPAMPSGAAYPPQPQYPPAGGYGYPQQAAPMPSTPTTPPAVAPSTPLTPPMPPGYAAQTPQTPQAPQAQGGYGQTMPAYQQQPGYAPPAPGYAPQPGYPQQQPYQPGFPPPQPPRRRSPAPIIIGSVGAILVLLIVAVLVVPAISRTFSTGTTTHQGTSTPQPTAPPSVKTFFQDALTSNTHGWLVDSTHCFFSDGGYLIENNFICYAPTSTNPDPNYTVSVSVKEISGSDNYPFGLSMRISDNNNVPLHYDFGIDTRGDWAFFKVQGSNATRLHDFTTNSAIKTGLNATNTLKVVVQGSTFTCYVNNTLLGIIHDSSYTSGKVGLFSDQYKAVFNNLLITQP